MPPAACLALSDRVTLLATYRQSIRQALASLPDGRAPTEKDWRRLSVSWRSRLDAQIGLLERLRDRLDECIGCGCLSMKSCRLLNPGDCAAKKGPGARRLLED